MPVEVLAGWRLGAFGEQDYLAQRWSAVILAAQWVGLDGGGQRAARWMRSPPLTVSMPVSKATSWAGQAARPLRGSSRSAGVLSFHHVLPDPGRGQQDPFGFRSGRVLADLLAQFGLEHGDVEFLLAEQGKLAAVLEPEEIGQPGRADALGAGGGDEQPVGGGEPGWVVTEDRTGQHVPGIWQPGFIVREWHWPDLLRRVTGLASARRVLRRPGAGRAATGWRSPGRRRR